MVFMTQLGLNTLYTTLSLWKFRSFPLDEMSFYVRFNFFLQKKSLF